MPTQKRSSGKDKRKPHKGKGKHGTGKGKEKDKDKDKDRDDDNFAPEEDPIVVTGGSVTLEFADSTNNRFIDDGSTPGSKKKFKNKTNGTDNAELTYVRITDKSDKVMMEIDLSTLGIKKSCKVKVFYSIP